MDTKVVTEPPDLSQFLSIYISEEEDNLDISNKSLEDQKKDDGVSVQDFLNGLSETTITPIMNDGSSKSSNEIPNKFTQFFNQIGPSDGKYCNICHKYFSKSKFNRHMITHIEEKEKPFCCDYCSKSFSRSDKLITHIQRIHAAGYRSHSCVCGRKFAKLHYLKSHLISHPLLSENFKDKILEMAKDEIENKVVSHKGMHKCPFCFLVFNGSYKLARHIRTHTGDKPYVCSCGVRFTRNEHLKKHKKSKSCPYKNTDEVTNHGLKSASLQCQVTEIKTEFPDCNSQEAEGQKDSIKKENVSEDLPAAMNNSLTDTKQNNYYIANGIIPTVQNSTTEIKTEPADLEDKIVDQSQKESFDETLNKFTKNMKVHMCEFCNKIFSKNHKLNIHRRIHTGERPFSCETCGKCFSRKDHLLKHTNVHLKYRKATKNFLFSQVIPDQGNTNLDLLEEIKQPATNEQNLLQNGHVDLQLLLNRLPEEDKIHYCPICNSGFRKYYNFLTHLEIHGERETFKCPICNREFKVKKNFEAHLLNHEADLEESAYPDSNITNDYLELAKTKRAQCLICNKWLVSQSSLIMHMRSHTGEKPHRCDTCDRYFVRKADMMRHRRRHTGENLFTCETCDVSYTRRDKLAAHMRKNHPGPEDFSVTHPDLTIEVAHE